MMRCNAASLMAGGGAVYLNFDTRSMQIIIKTLQMTSGGAFITLMRFKSIAALARGGLTSGAATLILYFIAGASFFMI